LLDDSFCLDYFLEGSGCFYIGKSPDEFDDEVTSTYFEDFLGEFYFSASSFSFLFSRSSFGSVLLVFMRAYTSTFG